MGTIDIDYGSLGIGLLLMLIPVYFLWHFKTGLLKPVLIGTVRMIIQLFLIGAYLRFLFEWNNPATLQPMGMKEKIGASLMQSVTMRTAGFNSVDLYAMRDSTKVFSIVLMFIGAAPGSTGGGIKVTTIAVIVMTAVSIIRGKEEPYLLCLLYTSDAADE